MKKMLSNLFSLVITLFILINILLHSNIVSESIGFGFTIWKENLFPYLFPLFVLSELLITFGFVDILGFLGQNIVQKLFKAEKQASYVFILSMLTGFPSSAKYLSQLYDNKEIEENQVSKILMFTHFSNPLFVVGTIAITFLKNIKLAGLILFCHYIPNIIIGIIFRKYHPIKKENTKSSFSNVIKTLKANSKQKLGTILGKAIINSINTLLLILGTVSIFLVITSILNTIFNFGPVPNAIINGIIEMSQGLKFVSLLSIPLRLKTTLSVMIISFGGLSVHLQIMSILSNTKIKYWPFLSARIIHSAISGMLTYLLFPILT